MLILSYRTTQELGSSSLDSAFSVTEGKAQEGQQQMSLLTQNSSISDYIALRTVPIVLRNGDRSLKVNALLNETHTKTYLNTDIAVELGLHIRTEEVRINVLNRDLQYTTSEPLTRVKMSVTVCTANKVTGGMPVINWNEYSLKWSYIKSRLFCSL